MGLVVVAIRVAFAIVVGAPVPGRVLMHLPEVTLPDWAAGVRLGGDVTLEGLLGAVYAGLQLATMLTCVGAANALANPRRLLRAVPGALYEVGVAVVVALSFTPQLVEGVSRVRAARRLRGRAHTGHARVARRRDAGARGRAGALGRPRGRDGRPRLRPRRRRPGRAPTVRCADPGRAAGRVRRPLRPDGRDVADGSRAAGARRRRRRRRRGPHPRRPPVDAQPLPAGPVGRPGVGRVRAAGWSRRWACWSVPRSTRLRWPRRPRRWSRRRCPSYRRSPCWSPCCPPGSRRRPDGHVETVHRESAPAPVRVEEVV